MTTSRPFCGPTWISQVQLRNFSLVLLPDRRLHKHAHTPLCEHWHQSECEGAGGSGGNAHRVESADLAHMSSTPEHLDFIFRHFPLEAGGQSAGSLRGGGATRGALDDQGPWPLHLGGADTGPPHQSHRERHAKSLRRVMGPWVASPLAAADGRSDSRRGGSAYPWPSLHAYICQPESYAWSLSFLDDGTLGAPASFAPACQPIWVVQLPPQARLCLAVGVHAWLLARLSPAPGSARVDAGGGAGSVPVKRNRALCGHVYAGLPISPAAWRAAVRLLEALADRGGEVSRLLERGEAPGLDWWCATSVPAPAPCVAHVMCALCA